jgi:hypothetical protein
MKLSELVHYLNQLERFSIDPVETTAHTVLSDIVHVVQNHPMQFGDAGTVTGNHQQSVMDAIQLFDNHMTNLKHQVRTRITQQEPALFQQSYQWYETQNAMLQGFNEYKADTYRDDYGILRQGSDKNIEAMRDAVLDNMMNRLPVVSEETSELLIARVRRYADWHYPAMIIHPGKSELIHHMVPNDPLYIIDEHRQLLQPAMNRFPESYQRRLRPYVVREKTDQLILDKIPNNQFLCCLVYNFFNYKPLDVIRQYLTEIYIKLRPGGVVLLTINDCDRGAAVELVEQTFACYTPGYLIRSLAETIGYQKGFEFNVGGPWTWIEFHKPGNLSTVRGAQVIGKKMPK